MNHVWHTIDFIRARYRATGILLSRSAIHCTRHRLAIACLTSGVLHGLLAFALWYKPAKALPPPAIEITIISRTEKPLNLNSKPHKESPRLGSEAFRHTKRALGTTLASEHYLERLRAHIEPHWHRFVLETKKQETCITVLNVDADLNGTVFAIETIENTCGTKLADAGPKAFWYANLLPPPRQFLDNHDILKLEWTFKLKRD